MRPYGRISNLKGSGSWKKDYHVIRNNRKIENWWEERIKINKRAERQMWKKILKNI